MYHRVIPQVRPSCMEGFVDYDQLKPWDYHMNGMSFKTSALRFDEVFLLDGNCFIQGRGEDRDLSKDALAMCISSIHVVVAGQTHVLNMRDATGTESHAQDYKDMPKNFVYTKKMMLNCHPGMWSGNLYPTEVSLTMTIGYNPVDDHRVRVKIEGTETWNGKTTPLENVIPLGYELEIHAVKNPMANDLVREMLGIQPDMYLFKIENPYVGPKDHDTARAMVVSAKNATDARKNFHPDNYGDPTSTVFGPSANWPGRWDQHLVSLIGSSFVPEGILMVETIESEW